MSDHYLLFEYDMSLNGDAPFSEIKWSMFDEVNLDWELYEETENEIQKLWESRDPRTIHWACKRISEYWKRLIIAESQDDKDVRGNMRDNAFYLMIDDILRSELGHDPEEDIRDGACGMADCYSEFFWTDDPDIDKKILQEWKDSIALGCEIKPIHNEKNRLNNE